MLDRLGNEVDFAELFMEETLSAKDKKELPDSMYGLVYTDEKGNKVRKFPLNDESHVRQAAIFFDRAKGLSDDQKRELARNIVRRAKELDMDYSGWESLKPYLDKPIKESYDPDPDSTTGTSNFDDSHDDPDDCFCESFEEMFGYIIQETYKPYDEYLKLHQYDPKTNTIIINGKRVNAGIMGSNKQRNRMNKFLRENNYNPKDGTIETSIDENGKKKRVDFNITPGEDGKSENYQYVKNGQIVGKDFDISMSPKSISGKPGLSNQTKEHETGHGDIYLNREKYEKDFVDSSMHNLKKSQSGAYDNGHKPQVAHAKDPEENVADVYGTTHNRYGTSWHNTQMNKFMSQEKVVNNKLTNNIDNWKKKQDSILKRNEENTPTPSSDVDSEFKRLKKEQEDWEDEIKEAKAAGDPVYVSRKGKILLNASDEEIMNMAKDSINKAQEAHLKKLNEARQSVDEKYVKMKKDNRDHIRSYNNEMNSRKEFVQNKLNQNQNQQQSTDANDSPPPIKESFEEIFGSVIQEAFDAITGEEIPINHAYTMEEMAKRTFSEFELQHIKHNDEMEHVNKIFFDECYFASPTDYGKSMTLDGPLFVTPYKAIASIFCGRDKVKESIPKIGSYNLGYKEWTDVKVHGANNKPLNKPLKEVHVYIEGYPFLESKTIEAEGFIHCINAKTYNENFYKYPWMAKDDREYLIANTDGNKVEFTRTIKCKVRYIIEGKPARPGQDDLGPRPNGLTHWIHEIANKIHAKYKADQKKPTGNQNCLLCSWCAEAQMRGQDYLPRPIYSPRDPALEIVPGDIIGGVTKKNPGNFYDMLEQLRGDSIKQPFARWYCHVKWGHSNGGHEFLIVKVDDDSFVIMDAQQGTVKPLNADNSYMKNVDWEGTYICRIDDKPFKYMKLDKINDPKKTLPWDPKKDIPYMVKHGLCTKEEAEKELKKTETNLFTSELKKALDQTPIQEGAWNDIRNGVNPWSKKRVFHITQQGHLDGQIFNPRVPEYLDKYDPSKDKFEDVDNPRVCFSPSIEGALNAIMVTIGRWKTADKLRDWYVYIPEKPIDQYKHKTTKELVNEKKVYDANVTNEVWIEEPVRLKQYGIIRVDQVSDKHIKKTVPTTTGFQGHRYRYDFKYHWVVKPKVIADVPYDYTPMGVCKDMVDEGYNFKYGLGANGSVQKASPEEYDKNYRLESPEEFEKNGGGICFDFVEWQAGYLEAYGYTCRKFFISTETDDNMTHTFILVDDGNGEFIYPEISFELLQGVHEVKSPEEAIRMIIEKMIEYHKTESIKYYVWEYSGHPPYGSDIETCTKYFSKGEPFHEGTLNKPEKIK